MPRLHPIACLLLVLACPSAARAADRLTVTAPPPAQDAADRLVRSLAAACNSGDFIGFMTHFPPADWNALDPPAHLIDPNLEHLRGIRPGRGCANGRCDVR